MNDEGIGEGYESEYPGIPYLMRVQHMTEKCKRAFRKFVKMCFDFRQQFLIEVVMVFEDLFKQGFHKGCICVTLLFVANFFDYFQK